jgi:4-aminobutyrate aminotransferase-like enzyme
MNPLTSGKAAVALQDETLQRIYDQDKEAVAACGRHLMLGGGTRGGPVLHHGKGVRVWDLDGNSYIDCTAQSWALYLGYCHDELWAAINEQAQLMTHVHQGFDTLPRYYLARKLAEICPGKLNRVSFVPSSALALEGAMKIALKNRPGASNFVTLWDGYHGATLGTMGASWISTRSSGEYVGGSRFASVTRQFVRAPNPYCFRCYFDQKPESCDLMCARMLELTLAKGVNGPAAGVIVEPLQGSGGMIPLPRRYLQRIRGICDQFEVPLIFDEIQTYMRIGRFTAAEYYGVEPDMIALGKALGGGLPLGATVIRDGLEGFGPDSEELHTFAANTLALVGATKLIEIVERDHILDHTLRMGEYLRKGLLRIQREYPEVADVRQVGLLIGVEFAATDADRTPLVAETRKVRDEAMKRGAIFGLTGAMKNLLKIKPPLIITEAEADEVFDIFERTLMAVLRS